METASSSGSRHNSVYACSCSGSRSVRFDHRAQLKQVRHAKQGPSSPHDDDPINRTEVGKVFRNRCRPAIGMLKIHAVLRQTFPAVQRFEFLPEQGMKRVHYSEPLQPLVTTSCSDKFCCVRRTRLQLSWSRLALRSRSAGGSAGSEKSLSQGGTDATQMDDTPDDAAGSGRTAPLGSGLPGTAGLDKRWTRRRSARRRGSGTSSTGGKS